MLQHRNVSADVSKLCKCAVHEGREDGHTRYTIAHQRPLHPLPTTIAFYILETPSQLLYVPVRRKKPKAMEIVLSLFTKMKSMVGRSARKDASGRCHSSAIHLLHYIISKRVHVCSGVAAFQHEYRTYNKRPECLLLLSVCSTFRKATIVAEEHSLHTYVFFFVWTVVPLHMLSLYGAQK